MADQKKSPSQMRVILAQFLYAHDTDIESLYSAIGADLTQCDADAVSHFAGIIDGINLATNKIRSHGIDNWAKS